MADTGNVPYRVVDRDNYGWYRAARAGGGFCWTTGPTSNLGPLTFDQFADLASERGPLRPVCPVTDVDRDDMKTLLRMAGRKAVATLAAALEQVFHKLREQHCGGNWSLDPTGGYQYAERTMKAGRAGSNEALLLIKVTWFGNALNLAKPTRDLRRSDVDGLRAAGPQARVDKQVRDAMTVILCNWVTNPVQYTEMAETLGYLVASFADEEYGRGGWAKVADQWLQPGGLAREDITNCYLLFYATSQHRDPSLAW